MNKEIKMTDGVLVCPSCDGINLHQEDVTVFKVGGESGVFVKEKSNLCFDIGSGLNPSKERQGMLIRFGCETCEADPELAIYQHKGITILRWNSARQLLSK